MGSTKETQRIEAFSDGIFAIAITLLVLEVHVPETEEGTTLFQSLQSEWTSFLALFIGFMTLLVCWINHHYMFTKIHRSDSGLLLLNGFKLLVVTVTPFFTAMLSKNFQTDWCDSAINFFCLNFAFMGIAMTLIWFYSVKKDYVDIKDANELKLTNRLYTLSSVFSIGIWVLSFFNIVASLVLSAVMFMIFCIPEKIITAQLKRLAKNQDLTPEEEPVI